MWGDILVVSECSDIYFLNVSIIKVMSVGRVLWEKVNDNPCQRACQFSCEHDCQISCERSCQHGNAQECIGWQCTCQRIESSDM